MNEKRLRSDSIEDASFIVQLLKKIALSYESMIKWQEIVIMQSSTFAIDVQLSF